MRKTNDDKELGFVLRHYRENAFNADEALKKIGRPVRSIRPRWVAAAASLLCLVAFASVLVWRTASPSSVTTTATSPAATTVTTGQPAASFHFDDTPLPEVLSQLGEHYGVQMEATSTTKHLTGDFAADSLDTIIRMIEEVLDVEITYTARLTYDISDEVQEDF